MGNIKILLVEDNAVEAVNIKKNTGVFWLFRSLCGS